ncbi:hypothetical protein GW17_00052784 [Ensete ventricosum]|nr:hypothetical protein GW17_00052784 [Ensete ventricosum]
MPTWHSVHFGCRPAIMSALRKDNKETWCANSDVYPQAVSSAAPGPETPVKSYPEQSRIVAVLGASTKRKVPHHPMDEDGPAHMGKPGRVDSLATSQAPSSFGARRRARCRRSVPQTLFRIAQARRSQLSDVSIATPKGSATHPQETTRTPQEPDTLSSDSTDSLRTQLRQVS